MNDQLPIDDTWAAANKQVERGRKPGWPAAAKLVLMFGVLGTFGHCATITPVLLERAIVATGDQPGQPPTLEVRAGGRSILLAGGINDGIAEQLDAALQVAPAVTTVVLSSNGGWVSEAESLANVIRKRGLNTYVEGHCASACTIVFLAGKEREAAASAKIGFHSGRVFGSMGIFYDEKNDQLRVLYQNAGLPDAFVRQAINTPSQKMWYPTHEDLRSAGVLTRTSTEGETAALSTAVRSKVALIAGFKGSSPD
jgi:ATP-dependent protease ClpP protease subunit